MKNKFVAAILALTLGIFGVHRFYLGKRLQGILHMILFFFTIMITIEEGAPVVMVPAILGFVDAVLLFVMPQFDFDRRYNKLYFEYTGHPIQEANGNEQPPQYHAPAASTRHDDLFKRLGIEKFRDFDFQGAVESFAKSLEKFGESPAVHFNLACCYSMLEQAPDAYEHLEKAVRNGFDALDKIHHHQALAFLRNHADFEAFVANNYQRPQALPAPQQADLLQTTPVKATPINTDEFVEQVLQLGDLRDKGLLTEDEFVRQKKKLLGE